MEGRNEKNQFFFMERSMDDIGFVRVVAGAKCQFDAVVLDGAAQSCHITFFHLDFYIGVTAVKLVEDLGDGDGTAQRSHANVQGFLVTVGELGNNLICLLFHTDDTGSGFQIDFPCSGWIQLFFITKE